MTEKQTFEQRLEQVKGLIDRIESNNLSLEDSVTQFEEGIKVLNELDREIETIQRRITLLQNQADGSEREVPLEENGHE
mgnify:CR=1 FL=1